MRRIFYNQDQDPNYNVTDYIPTYTDKYMASMRKNIELDGDCKKFTTYDFDQLTNNDIKYLQERLTIYE